MIRCLVSRSEHTVCIDFFSFVRDTHLCLLDLKGDFQQFEEGRSIQATIQCKLISIYICIPLGVVVDSSLFHCKIFLAGGARESKFLVLKELKSSMLTCNCLKIFTENINIWSL